MSICSSLRSRWDSSSCGTPRGSARRQIQLWKIYFQLLMKTQTVKSTKARRTQVIARKTKSAESPAVTVHLVKAMKAAMMAVMRVMLRHANFPTMCMTQEESTLGQKVTHTHTHIDQNSSTSSWLVIIACCFVFTLGSGNFASYEDKKPKKKRGSKSKASRGKGKKETKEKKEKRMRKEQEKLDKEKEKENQKLIKEQFNKGKKAQGACVFVVFIRYACCADFLSLVHMQMHACVRLILFWLKSYIFQAFMI